MSEDRTQNRSPQTRLMPPKSSIPVTRKQTRAPVIDVDDDSNPPIAKKNRTEGGVASSLTGAQGGGFAHLQPAPAASAGGFAHLAPNSAPATEGTKKGFAHLQPAPAASAGGLAHLAPNSTSQPISPDTLFAKRATQPPIPHAVVVSRKPLVTTAGKTPPRVNDADDVRLSALTPNVTRPYGSPEVEEINRNSSSDRTTSSKRSSGGSKAALHPEAATVHGSQLDRLSPLVRRRSADVLTAPPSPITVIDSNMSSDERKKQQIRKSGSTSSQRSSQTVKPLRSAPPCQNDGPVWLLEDSASDNKPSGPIVGKAAAPRPQLLPTVTPRLSTGRHSQTPLSNPATTAAQFLKLRFRDALILMLCGFLLLCATVIALPLWIDLNDHQLLFRHVPLVTELQATYRVPFASQTDSKQIDCLAFRVFAATAEDIDKGVSELERIPGWANSTDSNMQIATAYIFAWHRSRLYARSRDAHWFLHSTILYPLLDAWEYGLNRKGPSFYSPDATWKSLFERIWDALLCIRSDDELPCPSANYYAELYRHNTGESGLPLDSEGDYWYVMRNLLTRHMQQCVREHEKCVARSIFDKKGR